MEKEYSNKNWKLSNDSVWFFQKWYNEKYPAMYFYEEKKVKINNELKEVSHSRHGRAIKKAPNATYEDYLRQLIDFTKLKHSQQKIIMELPYSVQDIPDDYEFDKNSELYKLINEYHAITAPIVKQSEVKKEVSFELNEDNLIEG
jgi:hypothetical protein